jgi:hypothetical protein
MAIRPSVTGKVSPWKLMDNVEPVSETRARGMPETDDIGSNGFPESPLQGDEIRALRRLQREQGPSSHVFMTERDGPMTPKAFHALFGRIGARAKMQFPIHSCCGMAAATPWRTPATTRGRCRHGSGTRTFSTRCAIPSWPPIGSRISGDESRPPSAVDGGPVRVRQAAAQQFMMGQGTSSCGSRTEARSQRSSCAFIGLAYRP